MKHTGKEDICRFTGVTKETAKVAKLILFKLNGKLSELVFLSA